MLLTDISIMNAGPVDRVKRLFDELGLYLEVSPEGVVPDLRRKAVISEKLPQQKNDSELVARVWFAIESANWKNTHSSKVIRRFERDLFPELGRRPVAQIEPL